MGRTIYVANMRGSSWLTGHSPLREVKASIPECVYFFFVAGGGGGGLAHLFQNSLNKNKRSIEIKKTKPRQITAFVMHNSLCRRLQRVHSLFQSEFSTQCELVLPVSISNILPFPSGNPVAAYVFFFVFPPLQGNFFFLFYLSLNYHTSARRNVATINNPTT
jgi:hypothetical protein